MNPKSWLTFAMCVVITATGWVGAILGGRSSIALSGAALITVLCAAIVLFPTPVPDVEEVQPSAPAAQDKSAEFRRGVFELCAALKFGIRFCEEHLHSEPHVLLEELERMKESITTFVNGIARPVKLFPRPRWPWHASARSRTER